MTHGRTILLIVLAVVALALTAVARFWPKPKPKRPACPVDGCRISVPHSHAEALIRRMREK